MRKGMKKRAHFKMPERVAVPVKDLWASASEEEKTRAHRTCVLILSYWLGKQSKAEVAEALEVKPLRVWQLSQMAVSGMVCGLLRQPRRRGRKPMSEDVASLKKRILKLEKELETMNRLVDVLRDLPMSRESLTVSARGKKKATPKRAAATGGKKLGREVSPTRRISGGRASA